jgi:hypothetical protein
MRRLSDIQILAEKYQAALTRPGKQYMRLRTLSFYILLVWALQVQACNVPVFRYALEKWPADAYELVLYHQNGQIPAGVDSILQRELNEKRAINLIVKKIDVSSQPDKIPSALPWLELYYPAHSHMVEAAWSGPCTRAHLLDLLYSKARARMAELLLAGDALAWVVLKSGDQNLDDRALAVVQKTLADAQQKLKIPETGTDSDGNPIPVTDFKDLPVTFHYIVVDRSDPAEYIFVQMLLHSESDLPTLHQPMAFPVFGRGRLLYALVGDGINEINILEACTSAISWCSCEIKALNPGIDLLLAADWTHPAYETVVKDKQLDPIVGITDFVPAALKPDQHRQVPDVRQNADTARYSVDVPQKKAVPLSQTSEPEPPASAMHRNLLVLAGAIGMLLLVGSILLVRKRGHER